MGWASEAYEALKKVILIEDRMGKMVDELKKLGDLYANLNARLIRLEAKLEVYENLARAARGRKALKSPD